MTLAGDIAYSKQLSVAGHSVASLFSGWAARVPDKPFLIWSPFEGDEVVWTYADFWQASGRVAAGLAALGVRPGSRFILHMDNAPEFLLTWLASARLGAVVVTTNTKCSADEVAYFAEKSGAIGAVTQAPYVDCFAQPAASRPFFLVAADFEQVLLQATGPVPDHAAAALDEFSVQFTSGTTSRPKGVVWTHANAIWGAQTNARHFGLRHEDICHTVLPLFHTNAQSYSLLGTLWAGGTLLLQPRFSASHFWGPAVRHRATWASLIPFCVKAALSRPVPADHAFRLWVPAVALPDVVDGPLGIRTMGLWGMTETITQGIVGDPLRSAPQMSIGRAAPGYDIRIRRDDGGDAGPGEQGRLYIRGVRGVTLFKEYLDDPAATAAAFDADDWFDTGDRIRVAADGELFFMDREKDMLKVGGENVAASEVEAVILATGLVAEVAVVGQKHAMLDEVPVAFVIPVPGAPADLDARLIATCADKLAAFKVVRAVHVVDALPRSTLEKVAKNVLRDRLPEISA